MNVVLSTTLIALAVIGVSGAALLTGHASFDQFMGLSAAFGGVAGGAHLAGAAVVGKSGGA